MYALQRFYFSKQKIKQKLSKINGFALITMKPFNTALPNLQSTSIHITDRRPAGRFSSHLQSQEKLWFYLAT